MSAVRKHFKAAAIAALRAEDWPLLELALVALRGELPANDRVVLSSSPDAEPRRHAVKSPAERAAEYRRRRHAASRETSRASRDDVTENVTGSVTDRHAGPSPLSDSPPSGTSLSDAGSSSGSSSSDSLREGSDLERRAPEESVTRLIAARDVTRDAGVRHAQLPDGFRVTFDEIVTSVTMTTGRTVDVADYWERFHLWTLEKAPLTADWGATARRWVKDRIKFDAQDERRAKTPGRYGRPVQGGDNGARLEAAGLPLVIEDVEAAQ